MKTFKQYVTEAKQVGTLYHYTSMDGLHGMLATDPPMEMYSHNRETISTTRNNKLHMSGGYNDAFRHKNVRIALDGDKISERHKIKPISGLIDNEKDVFNHSHNNYRVNRNSGEAEEAIQKSKFHAREYIKHIHIAMHRDSDATFKEKVEPLLKKHGIPYTYGRGAFNEEFDFNPCTINELSEIVIYY